MVVSKHLILLGVTQMFLSLPFTVALPELPVEDPNFPVPPKDGKCRALAMRGGGVKGAYEIGAFKAFTDLMAPIQYAYDVVVGVSCGGINTGIIATFSRGFEKIAAEYLWEMWSNLPITDLWSNWALGPFEAIWRSAFIDNQLMIDMFNKVFNGRSIKRGLAVQTIDLNSGEVVIYDESMPDEFLGTAIMSSASIPGLFKPIYNEQQTLVDGLVLSNLDLSEAITKCQDMGFDDEDIIVDVVVCFNKVIRWDRWTMDKAKFKNAYDLYQRKEYFQEFYEYYEDITRVVRGYPRVKFRHLITPHEDLNGNLIPLWDGTDMTKRFLDRGYEDAKKSLEFYFKWFPEEAADYQPNVQSQRSEHPTVKQSQDQSTPNLTFASIREMIEQENNYILR